MRDRYQQIRRALAASARWWAIAILLALVAVAAYLARNIPSYPHEQAAAYRANPTVVAAVATMEPKDQVAFYRDVLQYETDNQIKIWTGLVTLFTGVAAVAAGIVAWRNLRVAQEGQITNRFTQAIGQIGAELKDGKPNLEVRLGGIYALERIARDSPRDHWTIMEILTAYVRENARWVEPIDRELLERERLTAPPLLCTDVQAILTVIGRRIRSGDRPEAGGLYLVSTALRGAYLRDAHLEGAVLEGAHLEGANLRDAHLEGADLESAHLERASLQDTHLEGANLANSDITPEQVYSAHDHGQGALTPDDWPSDWRNQFETSTNQPPATPSAP